jgi:uncharacterized protein YceH (UPF0502 family)
MHHYPGWHEVMTASSDLLLNAVEARVLGVLAEKQRTVPDTYPLTLNALVSGCNQKSSRDPVMELGSAEVQQALDSLRRMTLVIESSGGRVARYEHNIERVLNVPTTSASLLAVLMLRGPQTAGELRINCDRLHRFADISAVEGFLRELAERPAGALVAELPRQPGSREIRWAHLLCGAPASGAPADGAQAAPAAARGGEGGAPADALGARVEALEARVDQLHAQLAALLSERK